MSGVDIMVLAQDMGVVIEHGETYEEWTRTHTGQEPGVSRPGICSETLFTPSWTAMGQMTKAGFWGTRSCVEAVAESLGRRDTVWILGGGSAGGSVGAQMTVSLGVLRQMSFDENLKGLGLLFVTLIRIRGRPRERAAESCPPGRH